jgi:hypothetical protein
VGHARHLGRRQFRTGREHHAAGGDHRVERAVGERELLSVPGAIVDIQTVGLGPVVLIGAQQPSMVGW